MATIYLSQSSKTDANGESEILIRFSHGKINQRGKTNIFLSPTYWNEKEQCIIIPKARLLNNDQRRLIDDLNSKIERLSNLSAAVLKSFNDADKSTISPEWLKSTIDKFNFPEKYEPKKVEIEQQAFFAVFEEFLIKHPLSEVRKNNFRVVVRSLKRFELYKRIIDDVDDFELSFDNLDPDILREYVDFLRNESKIAEIYPDIYKQVPESRKPAPRGQNTINGLLTKLRTFVIWCVDNEKSTNNPFRKFTVEECVYGTPYYISIEERNILYNTNIEEDAFLEIQKNIFVFQCLIGCRVSDYFALKKKNIINDAVEYIARKTKDGRPVTVRVPLNSLAKEILEKFKDYEGDSLFPFTYEQDYNIAIKKIFTIAKLTRPVTLLDPLTREMVVEPLNEIASSHLARRCFVGNLYKQVKDPNLVGALSGHKEGSRAFARYREIDEDMKTELVKMLE